MKLKKNDNVPRIRFDYFKEEWDEKRFKDFTKLSQGLQIAISSRFLEGGENRYFYITNEFLNPNSTKKYYIESPSENVICTVDDILMTRTGNTGKVITNISGAFHNNFFKVDYDNLETSKMFLYYLLTSNDIQKEIIIRAGNSTIPDLNHSDFYSIKTSIPALAEQSAIGSLFHTLDALLSSYKDNLANYQSLKATMLSKMFPKAGRTVPEIRLDGFEGEWEIKKFKSISNKRGKSNSKGYDYPAYSVSNQSGLIPQSEQFEGSCLENLEKTSYKIVEPNEFAYNPARINVGSIAFNDIDETVIVSSLYVIFSLDKSINNDYALLFIKSPEFNKEVRRNTEGSVREYLFYENFANIRIPIPPTFEEQQAIGAYFSNLDNLINSHQEKISQLETLKKKLLQDMFI